MTDEMLQRVLDLVAAGGEGAFWIVVLYLALDFLRPIVMSGLFVGASIAVVRRLVAVHRELAEREQARLE